MNFVLPLPVERNTDTYEDALADVTSLNFNPASIKEIHFSFDYHAYEATDQNDSVRQEPYSQITPPTNQRKNMSKILNLTRYPVTKEQEAQGAVEAHAREKVLELLTFHTAPTYLQIVSTAVALANIAVKEDVKKAAIGGPAFLTSTLESALLANGIVPVYPYYKSQEVTNDTQGGESVSVVVANHISYVEAMLPHSAETSREELDKQWDKV